ncbi:MAG: hypothetical protein IKV73_01400 [Clostridia bacterium]|nr:hypothetical protein [Clostridia bacterium]
MKTLALVLLVLGACVSYGSKLIVSKMLRDKREANDADYVYVKLAGFALVLSAALIILL